MSLVNTCLEADHVRLSWPNLFHKESSQNLCYLPVNNNKVILIILYLGLLLSSFVMFKCSLDLTKAFDFALTSFAIGNFTCLYLSYRNLPFLLAHLVCLQLPWRRILGDSPAMICNMFNLST